MIPANRGVRAGSAGQRGASLAGVLLVVVLAWLMGGVVLRLVPVYFNHYKIKASLESIRSQPDLAARTMGEIVGGLQKRWDIDTVSDVTTEDVTITRIPTGFQVRVAYDVVRPFVGNLEFLMHFDDTIEAELP